MTPARSARIDAPAKINLVLRVLGRRPDGYHELETVFQALELADSVRVSLDPTGPATVSLDVHGPDLGPPSENLAVRAAEAFRAAFGLEGSVHVELVKRIPAGGGLGGGSSDAAAVLRALGALSERSASDAGAPDRLHHVASGLGSDVPFFLQPTPLARAHGRGELLTPLPALPRRDVVVALPPVHVSTPEAYRALARGPHGGGAPSGGPERSAPTGAPGRGGEGAEVDAGIPGAAGHDWRSVEAVVKNDFEAVVAPMHPEIRTCLAALEGAGASTALLSGSGAASFGLFRSPEEAAEVAERLTGQLGWPFVPTATRTDVPVPVVAAA